MLGTVFSAGKPAVPEGQISKLLGRLTKLGLIHNTGQGQPNGEPNDWTLTHKGTEIQQALGTETSGARA